MGTFPQNVYAKCLPSHRGYPLWCPEPPSNLPSSYLQDGLQIGDVGFVDREGRFNVLLNITYDQHHALHKRKVGVAFGFDPIELDLEQEVIVQSDADPPGCVITSPGIVLGPRDPKRAGHYEFTPTSNKGAILILHDGTTSHSLPKNECFRGLAMKHAMGWYKNAKKDYGDSISNNSLYLITGFRKARSWSLASFYDTSNTGPRKITVVPREGEGNTTRRDWGHTFPVEYRDGPGSGPNLENQTVFITGFKIAVRDDVLGWLTAKPEIHPVPPIRSHRTYCFPRRVMRSKGNSSQHQNASTEVEHCPTLSPPPFHPSDLINEYLLNKDRGALVAVTHDSEWMGLMETEDITMEHLMQRDRLEELLSAHYSLISQPEDMSVYLCSQNNNGDTSARTGVQPRTQSERSWKSKPPTSNHVVITRIRAEDFTVGLSRMPIGFYVLVQFDDTKRKTENRPVRLNDNTLEWNTCIQLPCEPSAKIQLSVRGSFEFFPMLGDGEALFEMEIHVRDLLSGGHLITLSPTKGKPAFPCSSVFIAVEQQHSRRSAAPMDNVDDFEWETSSDLAQLTDHGHNALLRYRDDPRKENITASIGYFHSALNHCPPGHRCRSAALCNLAIAHFARSQAYNEHTSHLMAISCYREALELRESGHLDRPATLLQLARALLYHCETRDCEPVNPNGIMELATKAQKICAADSHERRAVDLLLQSCNLYEAVLSGSLVDVTKFIPLLRRAMQDIPQNYFDRLQRVTNLSLALRTRYQLCGDHDALNESITIYEEAMQLTSYALHSLSLMPVSREWTKLKLTTGTWKDALAAATGFLIPRRVIYRVICEDLELTNKVMDTLACFRQMCSELAQEIDSEWAKWTEKFESRLRAKLEDLGDASMNASQYDEAVSHFTAALSLNPATPQDLLGRRSRAYLGKGEWEDALTDANEVLRLDPFSLLGYGRKYAALYSIGRLEDAAEVFETMLLKMSGSSDPEIRERSHHYIRPEQTEQVIHTIVQDSIRDSPLVLINTASGRLCNKSEQASAFEKTPIFVDLISSMTTSDRIEQEVGKYFRYATFSHKWEDKEPLYRKVSKIFVYDLKSSPTHDKLSMFCKIAREAGFHWAWSDTCCINKRDHIVLQEALVSMFGWYERSAMTIIFLRGVGRFARRGALARSVWNTRAWTLLEYRASKVVRFYTEDWTPYLGIKVYNHKDSPEIISEMEEATGIPARAMMALRPGLGDLREKLRLTSTRQTTLVEDEAYSLLGIFSVSLPIAYGEGNQALGRLLAQLLTSSGDTVSVLAWTGRSGSFNSCLPSSITVYRHPPASHIPLNIDIEMGTMCSLNLALVERLYDQMNELPLSSFIGHRMKLPCLTFKLETVEFPPISDRLGRQVVYSNVNALGDVEIRTLEDLYRLDSLYLVHPWIDFLLDRQPVGSATDLTPENMGDSVQRNLSSIGSPIRASETLWPSSRFKRPPGGHFSPGTASFSPPSTISPMAKRTRVLQFLARLQTPFHALLLTCTGQNTAEYRRVAAESVITVRVQDLVSAVLEKLVQDVQVLDVL